MVFVIYDTISEIIKIHQKNFKQEHSTKLPLQYYNQMIKNWALQPRWKKPELNTNKTNKIGSTQWCCSISRILKHQTFLNKEIALHAQISIKWEKQCWQQTSAFFNTNKIKLDSLQKLLNINNYQDLTDIYL